MHPREISIAAYDYPLPPERIARHPLAQRDMCRMLTVPACYTAEPQHRRFRELPELLPPGTLLVRNNTRVIPARIRMHKPTGAAIEIFLLDPAAPADYASCFESKGGCEWMCMVGNLKKWHDGKIFCQGEDVRLEAEKILQPEAGTPVRIHLGWQPAEMDFATVLESIGRIPIPPYLERDTEDCDKLDYQTIYSQIRGSVAAPTAGLHFTPELFAQLDGKGISTLDVTLHVGAGTFKPVKSDTMAGHVMHVERFEVTARLIDSLMDALREGRKIVAVGTTSVRTIESLPLIGAQLRRDGVISTAGQWDAYDSEIVATDTLDNLQALAEYLRTAPGGVLHAATALMIAPGFKWRVVSGMVTNFHQPRSTLLLLVSSFLERNGGDGERWRRLYDRALAEPDYRFLSYGDACLLL